MPRAPSPSIATYSAKNVLPLIGKDIDIVDSKRTVVGDVDFSVMMCRSRQIHELFEGTAYRIPSNMHSITVPAGKKVFFELTSEGGASVTTKRKGEALSKFEKQANFYHTLFQKTIQPKNNLKQNKRPTEGDIVMSGTTGSII